MQITISSAEALLIIDRSYRPDKGLIKALLQVGAVETQEIRGELCFALTARGRDILGSRT